MGLHLYSDQRPGPEACLPIDSGSCVPRHLVGTHDYCAERPSHGRHHRFRAECIFARDYTGLRQSLRVGRARDGRPARWITYSYRKSIYQAAQLEVASTELGRYFSPAVRETIVTQQVSFGGARVKAAVLFSDIRGFTTMSEKMSPKKPSALRDYHERMVEVIYRNGGTVDKFIGDGIMVTFGTPQPAEDDAARAVKCALEMQAALAAMNQQSGMPVSIGIGIDFGDVIAGDIGSASRLEYTVIGDTVNTASRIESATKDSGKSLLFLKR